MAKGMTFETIRTYVIDDDETQTYHVVVTSTEDLDLIEQVASNRNLSLHEMPLNACTALQFVEVLKSMGIDVSEL